MSDTAPDRITSRFNRKSTALEVVEGLSLKGRHIIVTGGAAGWGWKPRAPSPRPARA